MSVPPENHWQYSHELRYFLAVAEHGSLSAASEQAYVAVSAISRQIAQLEKRLGMPLFKRHARGMQLTEAGHLLERQIRLSQQETNETIARIHDLQMRENRRLRILSSESVAFELLPMLMSTFRNTHPPTVFHVEILPAGKIPAEMIRGRFDIAIHFSLSTQPDPQLLHAYDAPMCLFMHQDHPLARSDIDLAMLKDWPLALPHPVSTVRELFSVACKTRNLHIEPAMVCDSFATQYNTVRHHHRVLGFCSPPTLLQHQGDGLILKDVEGLQVRMRQLHIRHSGQSPADNLSGQFAAMADQQIRRRLQPPP